jgi:hypothetical protein
MLQDLLLSIMKMSVMLKKQFVRLTMFHLVMISDDYLWSGLGVNVGVIVMVQRQIRSPQKLSL